MSDYIYAKTKLIEKNRKNNHLRQKKNLTLN
jgi:hypothetical protein